MTTPPSDGRGAAEPAQPGHAPDPAPPSDSGRTESGPAPVSVTKPADDQEPFDPYRFGAPEHPVPPEYAPPGYQPPGYQPPAFPPAGSPYPPAPGFGPPSGYSAPPGYGPAPGYGPPSGYSAPPGYGPPPYPYAYAPPTQHGYPPPAAGNGKAIAGMILGILSIVFFWTTFFDLLLILPAVLFGTLGLAEARRTNSGRAMARAGLICTTFGTIFALVFTVVVVHRINTCDSRYSRGSSSYNSCLRTGS